MAKGDATKWTLDRMKQLLDLWNGGKSLDELIPIMKSGWESDDFPTRQAFRRKIVESRERGLVTRYEREPTAKKRAADARQVLPENKDKKKKGFDRWSEAQDERLFNLCADGMTVPQANDVVNKEFGLKRKAMAAYQRMAQVRKNVALEEKAEKRAAKKKKGSAIQVRGAVPLDIAIPVPGRGHVLMPEGRAITLDFAEGSVRLLLHGKLPSAVVGAVSRLIAEAAVA